MPVRIEEIIERIRREIAEEVEGAATDRPARTDLDSLPAVSGRPELEYLNRHWRFDPLSELRSHRRLIGPLVVRFKRVFRRLVVGVLEGYFEKERSFLLELIRFNNALAERADRLLREVTERTKAVAERNDLFLGALDLRLEALEAREQMRRGLEGAPTAFPGPVAVAAEEEAAAEMAAAFAPPIDERIRRFVERIDDAARVLVLGCGDGEALTPFAGRSGNVLGVEASAALVATCRRRGFSVEVAALAPYLESAPEGSLDMLVLTRVTDRHAIAAWPRLVAAAWRALRPGGLAVLEGIVGPDPVARMRWLLSRQRFAIVDARDFPIATQGGSEHVIVASRSESS